MKKGWFMDNKAHVDRSTDDSVQNEWNSRDKQEAFTLFYRQHYEKVFRYVRAMRFPLNHTGDLASKVFERCWLRFDEYLALEDEKKRTFWPMRIAENVCKYEKRRLWRRGEVLLAGVADFEQALSIAREGVVQADSVEEQFLRQERLGQFIQILQGLPRKQAEVIRLRLEGFTYSEIGELLHISDEACRRRMLRAVVALKTLFANEMDESRGIFSDLVLGIRSIAWKKK